MLLKCKATCTEVHKKSQSPAFKDLRYGDIIEFLLKSKQQVEIREHMLHTSDALIHKQKQRVNYRLTKL